jgi:hypothetical protein
MAIFAHPDVETIAPGARLRNSAVSGFIPITDGAPRDPKDRLAHGFASFYRRATTEELGQVLRLARIAGGSCEYCGL